MVKVYSDMKLNDLKKLLKQEVKNISLNELYQLSLHFHTETEYLPKIYKEEYTKSVQNIILTRITSLKNDNNSYEGKIEDDEAELINELLVEKEDIVNYMLNITVVYATYFLNEPIHNIKTIFPGAKRIYKKGKYYYCPVKKYHINNNESLCKYCIAKIDEG